jgi:hypothetical protein
MELNTPIKILAFCISSFQNSWRFAFHGELNTTLVFSIVRKLTQIKQGIIGVHVTTDYHA